MDVSPYVEGHHDTAAALTPDEHAGMEEVKSDDLHLRMPAPQAVAQDVVAAVLAAPDEHEALAVQFLHGQPFSHIQRMGAHKQRDAQTSEQPIDLPDHR